MISNVLEKVSIKQPQCLGTMVYVPLTGGSKEKHHILSLRDALRRGEVEVVELESSGVVDAVRVINRSFSPLIVMDGEHLVGAKQNRVVNKTVIVGPHSTVVLPVSCTEKGRWHYRSRAFVKSPAHSPISIRRLLKQTDHAQEEVWKNVDRAMSDFEVKSETSSLDDVYASLGRRLDEKGRRIRKHRGQIGFAVFIKASFMGMDVVFTPSLFRKYHDEILRGYMIDSLRWDERPPFRREDFLDLSEGVFEELSRATARRGLSIGMEDRIRLRAQTIVGELVSYEGRPVHLSAVPA